MGWFRRVGERLGNIGVREGGTYTVRNLESNEPELVLEHEQQYSWTGKAKPRKEKTYTTEEYSAHLHTKSAEQLQDEYYQKHPEKRPLVKRVAVQYHARKDLRQQEKKLYTENFALGRREGIQTRGFETGKKSAMKKPGSFSEKYIFGPPMPHRPTFSPYYKQGVSRRNRRRRMVVYVRPKSKKQIRNELYDPFNTRGFIR